MLLLGRRSERLMGEPYGNCWFICHCYSIIGVADRAESGLTSLWVGILGGEKFWRKINEIGYY